MDMLWDMGNRRHTEEQHRSVEGRSTGAVASAF